MNIFATDSDTSICATYHTDKHTIKMPLELSQMVSFVYNHKELWDEPIPQLLMSYSATHDKHPCSLWIQENLSNFMMALFSDCSGRRNWQTVWNCSCPRGCFTSTR